jgi:hypothetical protein
VDECAREKKRDAHANNKTAIHVGRERETRQLYEKKSSYCVLNSSRQWHLPVGKKFDIAAILPAAISVRQA